MKYFSALLLTLILFSPRPALASYQSAYSDYATAFSSYRSAHNDYQIAKSAYATYGTLAAETEAIKKLQIVLKNRDQVMLTYIDLLNEKLAETDEVSGEERDTFAAIAKSEKEWLTQHQEKIAAAASLEDLNAVSSEFASHYPQMQGENNQAIATVLLARENALIAKTEELAGQLSARLLEINQSGERGIAAARTKRQLAVDKVSQAKTAANAGKELFIVQQRLVTANQYLREAINLLLETANGASR